jgi:hypothetical protein
MRFDLVRPCGDCPFRSDNPFSLSRERVLEILGDVNDRQWWPAASFPCQCAGVMAILHRERRWNQAMQIAQRLGMWDPMKLDQTAPFYESTDAAIDGQFRCRRAR